MVTLLRIFWGFLVRDFRTETSYRLAFMLRVVGLFNSAMLWYFMARFIESSGGVELASKTSGMAYHPWAVLGIVANMFQEVSLNSFASSIRNEQTTGTLEAMLVTPARLPHLIYSSSAFSYVLAAINSGVFLLFGMIFGVRLNIGSLFGAFCAIFLTVVAISGIGILSAAFVLYFKRGNPVTFIIGSATFMFGNVIYPTEALPPALQTFSRFVPMNYATRALRESVGEGSDFSAISDELTALAISSLVLLPTGLIGARLAIRRAKREGSLIQY